MENVLDDGWPYNYRHLSRALSEDPELLRRDALASEKVNTMVASALECHDQEGLWASARALGYLSTLEKHGQDMPTDTFLEAANLYYPALIEYMHGYTDMARNDEGARVRIKFAGVTYDGLALLQRHNQGLALASRAAVTQCLYEHFVYFPFVVVNDLGSYGGLPLLNRYAMTEQEVETIVDRLKASREPTDWLGIMDDGIAMADIRLINDAQLGQIIDSLAPNIPPEDVALFEIQSKVSPNMVYTRQYDDATRELWPVQPQA